MIKSLLKRTFAYSLWQACRKRYNKAEGASPEARIITEWLHNGRPAPPPHLVKVMTIQAYASRHQLKTLVETGTYLGQTTEACLSTFDSLFTIELDEQLYQNAVEKFKDFSKVHLFKGDSGEVLGEILPDIKSPALFWLDGHYSEGITAKGQLNTPIIQELSHIFAHPVKQHTILIDDARCFTGADDYPTIDELRQYIHTHRRDLTLTVADDIIRIYADTLPNAEFNLIT